MVLKSHKKYAPPQEQPNRPHRQARPSLIKHTRPPSSQSSIDLSDRPRAGQVREQVNPLAGLRRSPLPWPEPSRTIGQHLPSIPLPSGLSSISANSYVNPERRGISAITNHCNDRRPPSTEICSPRIRRIARQYPTPIPGLCGQSVAKTLKTAQALRTATGRPLSLRRHSPQATATSIVPQPEGNSSASARRPSSKSILSARHRAPPCQWHAQASARPSARNSARCSAALVSSSPARIARLRTHPPCREWSRSQWICRPSRSSKSRASRSCTARALSRSGTFRFPQARANSSIAARNRSRHEPPDGLVPQICLGGRCAFRLELLDHPSHAPKSPPALPDQSPAWSSTSAASLSGWPLPVRHVVFR